MKKQLVRAAAATVLGLSLTTGFAAADINTTGPDSSNNTNTSLTSNMNHTNNNKLRLHNDNDQTASSGRAVASDSTNAGDAMTGDASNDTSLNVSADVSNHNGSGTMMTLTVPSNGAGNISNTGPDSSNNSNYSATSNVTVKNDTSIELVNDNYQSAHTGDATVTHNTNGGSASTGSASNSSSSSFDLSVSN